MPPKRSPQEQAQIAEVVRSVLASKPDQVWSVAAIHRELRMQVVLSPSMVERALAQLQRAGVVEPVRGRVHVGWRWCPDQE